MVRVPSRQEKDLTKFTAAISEMAQGRLNCVGTFSLATSSLTATTVGAPTVSPGTIVLLMPQTAHAAAAVATGALYIKPVNVTNGQFIVTHPGDTTSDRTFGFIAIGPAG